MNSPPFFSELKRRNLRRLAVAYVMMGLLVILATTMALALFEAAAGKGHPVVRRSTQNT